MEGERCGVSDPVPVGYTIYECTPNCLHMYKGLLTFAYKVYKAAELCLANS